MSWWLREAEREAEKDKDELYWREYEEAEKDIESGNIDAQSALDVLSDEDLELIVKALISGEIIDMGRFAEWRERAIEEEMRVRGF